MIMEENENNFDVDNQNIQELRNYEEGGEE